MQQSSYYRMPTIHRDTVIFVCEDDLWRVPVSGGQAMRLTTNLGSVTHPHLSPDGQYIAFTGREEGGTEAYCMPVEGGVARRLTFLGSSLQIAGWTPTSHIVFSSDTAQPFSRMSMLYTVKVDGGEPAQLPIGIAHNIAFAPTGRGVVIGRNTSDPARWKRYRGGTAGVLWIDPTGKGRFRKLLSIEGNLASPMWLGGRIYFISDHEGIGNLYSCTPDGEEIRRHTDNTDFYVRNASTDGSRIVYHAGGELFVFDPVLHEYRRIDVNLRSPQVQRNRKFVNSADYLEEYNIHPDGHSVVQITRGKPFVMANWEGPVLQLGKKQGVRYQYTNWLHDNKRFVTISDEGGEEVLEVFQLDAPDKPLRLPAIDIGRVLDVQVSPVADKVVLTNHRFELILVNLTTKKHKVLDRSAFQRIAGCAWSPDGQWVVYSCAETQQSFSIKLANVKTGKKYRLTKPQFRDISPSFDPDGKFIYFLSYREFNPVYDSMYFDLGFPRGMRPYLLSLQKDTPSPFASGKPVAPKDREKLFRAAMGNGVATNGGAEKNGKVKKIQPVQVDIDNIEERIAAFPVPEGRYASILGARGKVLFTSQPVKGALQSESASDSDATLEVYDLEEKKCETVATGVSSFKISRNTETLIYRVGNKLRVTALGSSERDKAANGQPGRATGWLDSSRIRLEIVPLEEWRQMYREIWRLQREHFWTREMSGINWERVYAMYAPVLEKVATRAEFSDLVWELQGELGTSHAYEYGGDYRKQPLYKQGFLGIDCSFNKKLGGYSIDHIVSGDTWNESASSPLARLGMNVQKGEVLLAINGRALSAKCTPNELLVHQAQTEVSLTIADAARKNTRSVVVKTLANETAARYREWVEYNRQRTLELSHGKVGYVHVPNMGPLGFAEFHRYYMMEIERDALLVDVRFNGGGHVSQLLLEKLARKRIGYDIKRWGVPESYPSDAVLGPIVALTNEYAGSDGDIFSHSFKLMNLGKLVGTRTWGGVIGIWPRHTLVDKSVTTQPEFSFWFNDVGWQVENYGTDPDIEVEITPQDWAKRYDRQLETAVKLLLDDLKKHPVSLPEFGNKPVLAFSGTLSSTAKS